MEKANITLTEIDVRCKINSVLTTTTITEDEKVQLGQIPITNILFAFICSPARKQLRQRRDHPLHNRVDRLIRHLRAGRPCVPTPAKLLGELRDV
jgi:hypothetical protein